MAENADKVLVPPEVVAEGMVLILSSVSILMVLFLAYIAYLITIPRTPEPTQEKRWLHGFAFLAIVAASLVIVYLAIRSKGWIVGTSSQPLSGGQVKSPAILTTSLALFVTMVVCAIYYFRYVRHRWQDDRIRYGMLLWAAFWLLTALTLIPLWWTSDHVKFDIIEISDESFSQFLGIIAQLVGIIIAAAMVVVTLHSDAQKTLLTARQEIYQRLELSSVELFRFECLHPAIAGAVWSDEPTEVDKFEGVDVTHFQIKEYFCQILNLFEMAVRFRHENVFEADIFGSWVVWMWEVCEREKFRTKWNDTADPIRWNYLPKLQEIMDAGIFYATEKPAPAGADPRRSFFTYVARATGDDKYLATWLDQTAVSHIAEYRKHWTDEHGRSVAGAPVNAAPQPA